MPQILECESVKEWNLPNPKLIQQFFWFPPPPLCPVPLNPKDQELAGTGMAKWEPANIAPSERMTTDLNARLIR